MKPTVLIAAALAILAGSTCRSAPFQNLDFEDADPLGKLLPGWSAEAARVGYRDVCLGSACITVIPREVYSGPPLTVMTSFSVYMQGGTSSTSGDLPLVGVSLSQAGEVPIEAKSIRLDSTFDSLLLSRPDLGPVVSYENLRVAINGEDIPLRLLEIEPYDGGIRRDLDVVLGGDITRFAGQAVNVTISTVTPELGGPEIWARLDNIEFSTTPVPEPSGLAAALCLLGFTSLRNGAAARAARADPRVQTGRPRRRRAVRGEAAG